MNGDELMGAREVLDKCLVRETLEDYLASLDNKDWDGIASCFTDDAVAATWQYEAASQPLFLQG